MKSLPVLLTKVGNSTAFVVPAPVVRLFGWRVGQHVQARLKEGGPSFEAKLRSVSSGKSVGIIVPRAILQVHGFELGQTVEVPFHEWELVRSSRLTPALEENLRDMTLVETLVHAIVVEKEHPPAPAKLELLGRQLIAEAARLREEASAKQKSPARHKGRAGKGIRGQRKKR